MRQKPLAQLSTTSLGNKIGINLKSNENKGLKYDRSMVIFGFTTHSLYNALALNIKPPNGFLYNVRASYIKKPPWF